MRYKEKFGSVDLQRKEKKKKEKGRWEKGGKKEGGKSTAAPEGTKDRHNTGCEGDGMSCGDAEVSW